MKKVPREVQNILDEDEDIEKYFGLKSQDLYATDRRLIEHRGRTIRDFDYAHISSVEYSSKRFSWWLIVIGLIIMLIGVASDMEGGMAAAVIIVGLILLIIGVMKKSERVDITILGMNQPARFEGSRDDLDSLLRLVREKRKGGKAT